ncbi:MAG: phosphatase PAP2 family protein [Saprospiraceae bacterium]|nr:phosphatase PAP2 family protein [Saprospiraceae bacterium]
MLDYILQKDVEVFHFINSVIHNQVLDFLLPLFRDKFFWIPLYVFILSYFYIQHKVKFIYIIILVVVTVFACDSFSSKIMKPTFKRERPCRSQADVRLLVSCGSGYSFTSSHATNHFGLAYVFTMLFGLKKFRKRHNYYFYIWAFLISFSQVYVGVHYPLDVFFGALFGLLIGFICCSIFNRFAKFESSF